MGGARRRRSDDVALGYVPVDAAAAAIVARSETCAFIAELIGLSMAAEASGAVEWFAGLLAASAHG